MNKFFLIIYLLNTPLNGGCLISLEDPLSTEPIKIILSAEQIADIAFKIWTNECGQTDEQKIQYLIHWNKNEDHASVGIMHFTWSKNLEPGPKNQFPLLRSYIEQELGISLPESLNGVCPWDSREELLTNLDKEPAITLKRYLLETIELQTRFAIIERFKNSLKNIYKLCTEEQLHHVIKQFYRLLNSPGGLFALIDTLNLSGEKGLYFALCAMQGDSIDESVLKDFVQTRINRFNFLVQQNPKLEIFLNGWCNRVKRYLE